MADMYGAVRSNCFKVKDAAKFETWFHALVKFGDEIELWNDADNVFSFGGYEQCPSAWPSIPPTDDDDCERREWDLEAFARELRKHLAAGQTFQVVAGGHEKLRYVGAGALIVPPRGKPMYVCMYSDDTDILKTLRTSVAAQKPKGKS